MEKGLNFVHIEQTKTDPLSNENNTLYEGLIYKIETKEHIYLMQELMFDITKISSIILKGQTNNQYIQALYMARRTCEQENMLLVKPFLTNLLVEAGSQQAEDLFEQINNQLYQELIKAKCVLLWKSAHEKADGLIQYG